MGVNTSQEGVWYILPILAVIVVATNIISTLIMMVMEKIKRFPAQINLFDIMLIAICAIILSVLSTWYPAWCAARLNPVEAIRYE